MQRRHVIQSLGAAALGWPAALWAAESGRPRRKLLFFSRSVLFEHPVVHCEGGALSFAEKQLDLESKEID